METFNQAILPKETYQELGSFIRPLVGAVNQLGVFTIESSEGYLTKEKSPYPYVLIALYMSVSCFPEKIFELLELVKKWNSYQKNEEQWIFVPNTEYSDDSPPSTLCLRPRESNSQLDPQMLHRLQKEASELASFLKEV